ncbi:MAG: hypothetical protein IRZ08_06935 [Frankia sp.]|nr:hypothetical protein [Frankia sp.]
MRRRLAFVLAGLLVVGAAGCGFGGGGRSESSAPVTSAPAAGPSGPPLAPEDYQAALTAVDTALGPGFVGLGGTLQPADVLSAADAIALNIATQAETLKEINPPVAAAAAHNNLVTALDQLADDLLVVSGAAARKEVCTGASGLPRAVNGAGAAAVRAAAQALATADPAHPYTVGSFLPGETPLQNRRLATGNIHGGVTSGHGWLTFTTTDPNRDTMVRMVSGGRVIRSIYIQGGETASVDKLPDGALEVYYTTGNDWDEVNQRFTRDCEFKKFDAPLEYRTRDLGSSLEYTIFELIVYGMGDTSVASSIVPPDAFPTG